MSEHCNDCGREYEPAAETEEKDSDSDNITRAELVKQAESILQATEASMYYPVAHGEAERLQILIEQRQTGIDDETEWYTVGDDELRELIEQWRERAEREAAPEQWALEKCAKELESVVDGMETDIESGE